MSVCAGYVYVREREIYFKREKKREIYFKELSHIIVDTSKSKTHRVDQQAREAGKRCITRPKVVCWQSSLWRVVCHFLKSFTDYLSYTYIMEENTLLKVTDLSVIPPQKYFYPNV